MNIRQIKTAIAKFKNANVSIIKDDALRAKAQKLQAKQKGFTLLELLVVITLLATLSTAALVAYDNVGENARDASAATAVNTLEGTLRTYRAIVGEYPEQFDNLANADADDDADGEGTGAMQLMSDETKAFFGQLTIAAATANSGTGTAKAIFDSLREAGLEELQSVTSATDWNPGYVPNLAMNESYGEYTATTVTDGDQGSEIEFTDDGKMEFDDAAIGSTSTALSIVPSGATGTDTCGVFADGDLQATFDGTAVITNGPLNLISDGLDSEGCDLVIAVGIGKEVPGATSGNAVEIGQVPTVGTNNINPRDNYARAIALFHVASDNTDEDAAGGLGTIEADEVFEKARLIAVVDAEGRTIEEIAAAAHAEDS
jgi:prepilin-type N-terminal cleavage/methylation domain-containing protein